MANTSFYVPGSLSGSYVASKRTPEGSLAYPAAETEIGIQKQAALQDLSKQYETTIENAYSSYLASQRNIMESAMGQGYKEQYLESQDQALVESLAQINANAASVRADLEMQESKAKETIQQQYQQEVTNLDRTAASFQNYLDYVKDLSYTDPETKETISALGEEYTNLGVDYLYETLYNLQPRETGIDGMSYAEWLQANIGKTEEDAAWYQWAQSGGLQDFLSAVRSRPDYQTAEQKLTADKAAKDAIEQEKINLSRAESGYIGTSTKTNGTYNVNGTTYVKDTNSANKGYVAHGSKLGERIMATLNIPDKLATGILKYGDMIEYNGEYYILLDYSNGVGKARFNPPLQRVIKQ